MPHPLTSPAFGAMLAAPWGTICDGAAHPIRPTVDASSAAPLRREEQRQDRGDFAWVRRAMLLSHTSGGRE